MKKLLALILAVIMLLSIMPIAYAKRAEYSPEIEQFIDNYVNKKNYHKIALFNLFRYKFIFSWFNIEIYIIFIFVII